MKIFAVYDIKSKTYSSFQCHINTEVAIREFTIASRNPQTLLNQFPEDYELHQIGEFELDLPFPITGIKPLNITSSQAVLNTDKLIEKNALLAQQNEVAK